VLFPRRKIPELNLEETTFCILDTETTGFNIHEDRILSIGIIRMNGSKILLKHSIELFIKPNKDLGTSPVIHGITLEDLEGGCSEEAAADRILDFIQDDVVVAHFASFDRTMMEQLFKRTGRSIARNIWIDTMDVQVILEPSWQGQRELLKLDHLLNFYSIEAIKRHSALGDAYSTARIFQQQLSRCKQRGISNLSAFKAKRPGLL
jgi:DNA polymerase-3 subunit epsilon